ncbi:hypothetical protein PUN28_018415 [Cardiocondyla obscurior]|uniref:Uncharacterized protein n=1 Tax=Cardiocondyla obscurior TaxID=286306 RepID=A0AAW2EEN6_9HYME
MINTVSLSNITDILILILTKDVSNSIALTNIAHRVAAVPASTLENRRDIYIPYTYFRNWSWGGNNNAWGVSGWNNQRGRGSRGGIMPNFYFNFIQ